MENDQCYWVIEDDLDFQFLVQLKFKIESRLKFCGAATNSTDSIELVRGTNPGVVVLDHFIEGQIMGLQLAPLIKAVAPSTRIILLTSHDLELEASREPAIDAYLRKSDLVKLLPTAQRLLGLEPVAK
ncbi:MAG: response regulator [Ilumatobacteraceae bacterium]